MSSTGRVSKVFNGPITSIGEDQRQESIDKAASPSLFETVREVDAVIKEVHEKKLLVKVYATGSAAVVANNQWIPLSHSPQEIAERFGTIRVGMTVRVSYQGPSGLNARAVVVLNEKEKHHNIIYTRNALMDMLDLGFGLAASCRGCDCSADSAIPAAPSGPVFPVASANNCS